jgi:hypothetical protein
MSEDERDILRRTVGGLARAHATMMESVIELRRLADRPGVADLLRSAEEAAAMFLEVKGEAERKLARGSSTA